jgi:23S rRNA (uracil1939-C5)-methyltransferase
VTIDAVAFGGDGIARLDGKVIFVPDTVPEEQVRITLIENKGRFARGKVLKRLRLAPYLQQSPCPYSKRCGGCQWLEVPYTHQLAWKQSFIVAAMQRIARWEVPVDFQVLASPEQKAYRNRIKVRLRSHEDGRLELGYYAKGSHELVAIESCWIAASPINEALRRLAQLRLQPQLRTSTYELELQHLAGDRVTAILLSPLAAEFRRSMIDAAAGDPWLREHILWPDTTDAPHLLEEDHGLAYRTFAGQFQQVNLAANRQLRTWVREKVLAAGARRILDVFCGSGNFSLQLAKEGREVWGIEVADVAITCAQENVRSNQLQKAHYAQGFAHQILDRFPELSQGVDCIIVDPPRKGMAEALAPLLQIPAPLLIYISCDPNTLARDLKELMAAGYQVEEGMGVDFFPHSYHVETVLLLKLGVCAKESLS